MNYWEQLLLHRRKISLFFAIEIILIRIWRNIFESSFGVCWPTRTLLFSSVNFCSNTKMPSAVSIRFVRKSSLLCKWISGCILENGRSLQEIFPCGYGFVDFSLTMCQWKGCTVTLFQVLRPTLGFLEFFQVV